MTQTRKELGHGYYADLHSPIGKVPEWRLMRHGSLLATFYREQDITDLASVMKAPEVGFKCNECGFQTAVSEPSPQLAKLMREHGGK